MGASARSRAVEEPLTGEQLAAITSDERGISVRAGPGSGKTRVLVERVSRRVADGRLDLARTLAITFTENAAAQMKARLAERFEELGLEQQRRRLEWAYISTIHGFCARLLREHAIEAGVDPRFRVLDEAHSGVLQQATLDGVLEQWGRSRPERFLEFARHFKQKEYDRRLLAVHDTVRRLGSNPENQAELLRPPELLLLTPQQAELERRAAGHREAVAELLGQFHRAYTQRKHRLSALDFDDLEESTHRMLAEWPELARRISRRFQEILVDEYQDTSPVQSNIIRMLAADSRLFVVGDPAQSIYGFRNADPAAFEAAWLEAGAGGQVDLRDDFRSRPEIILAVNRHFEGTFRTTGTPFSPLKAGSPFAEKQPPSVEILLVGVESGKMPDTRPLEARRLARRIRELVESKTLRVTNRKHPQCGRELGYGDVAMFFRSAKDMKTYERALEDAGIPYFAETGRGFYGAREVRDVVSFLRVLDNSRNEIALAAVLRSPMFGLSDDALYLLALHAHAVKNRVLADVLNEAEADAVPDLPPEDVARLREFGDLLARLRAERPWRSLAEMVREIVRVTSYDTTLLLEAGGRRKVANLHKLAEVAASLATAGFDSLNDFVKAVDRFHFEEVREGEAQLESAAEDAVRLMTMHAAKGLEFPVVVLPDLTRGPHRETNDLEFLPDFGLGVKFDDGAGADETPTLEQIRARLKERDRAEEKRVLFVAMTRAQEHLILSGCLNRTKKGFGLKNVLREICASFGLPVDRIAVDRQWRTRQATAGQEKFSVAVLATDDAEALEAEAPQQASVAKRYHAALAAGEPLDLKVDREAETEAQRLVAAALAPLPETDSTDFLAAVTDVLEFHRCPRRYYLGRYLGHDTTGAGILACHSSSTGILACHPSSDEMQDPAEELPADELPRTELGLAVHRLLAVGDGVLAALPAELRAETERLAERFRQSEYGRRAATADVRRELPVLASVDGHFLRGTLDLLTFVNGRPDLLLDYKANDITAAQVEEEAASYQVQMILYALLVEGAFGALPGEAVLFFLAPGVAHRVELAPTAFEEARGVLAELFAAQRATSFPPRVADHCFRCAFNGTLCLAPQRV